MKRQDFALVALLPVAAGYYMAPITKTTTRMKGPGGGWIKTQ